MELVTELLSEKCAKNQTGKILQSFASIKNEIWTCGARTVILLFDIDMEYSYKYGIMTQEHGTHIHHIDVDERRTVHKDQGTPSLGFPFFFVVGSKISAYID